MALEDCRGLPGVNLNFTGTGADINRDGHLDIVSNQGYWSGRGDGTFNPVVPVLTHGGAIVAGDLNGDGWPEIVSGRIAAPGLEAAQSDGRGGFRPIEGHLMLEYLSALGILDYDGDSRPDVVFGSARLCIAPNTSGNPDVDVDGVPDTVDTCIDSD